MNLMDKWITLLLTFLIILNKSDGNITSEPSQRWYRGRHLPETSSAFSL